MSMLYKMLLKLRIRKALVESGLRRKFLEKVSFFPIQQRQQRFQQHPRFSEKGNSYKVICKGKYIYVAVLLKNIDICSHIRINFLFYFFFPCKLFEPHFFSNSATFVLKILLTLKEHALLKSREWRFPPATFEAFSNTVDLISVFGKGALAQNG
jgi:hypothetical protein